MTKNNSTIDALVAFAMSNNLRFNPEKGILCGPRCDYCDLHIPRNDLFVSDRNKRSYLSKVLRVADSYKVAGEIVERRKREVDCELSYRYSQGPVSAFYPYRWELYVSGRHITNPNDFETIADISREVRDTIRKRSRRNRKCQD